MVIEKETFPSVHKTVLENDNCRIVIDFEEDYVELTKKTKHTEDDNEYITTETRYCYHENYIELEMFESLWENSFLLEEVLTVDDREVVINRKHYEIVLGKAEKVVYEIDGEEKTTYNWTHKYRPIYNLKPQDILDQFDQFWELEPYMMSAFAVPSGDYEIAGQVLDKGIDLGEGYENDGIDVNMYNKVIVDKTELSGTRVENIHVFNFINTKTVANLPYYVSFEIKIDISEAKVVSGYPNAFDFKNEDLGGGWHKVSFCGVGNGNYIHFYTNLSVPTGTRVWYRKGFTNYNSLEPKPFIKNSRPDSKLALPQLATLGAITSTEMRGNHIVAQHANGTAIIKNAVLNPNAPLDSLHWGLQAYKDENGNKRLFVSTADGTYPIGWENLKYDIEEGGNVVFYDVARNSTSNNIAGLITEENGQLRVYIGEGYENLCNLSNKQVTWTAPAVFNISNAITNVKQGDTYVLKCLAYTASSDMQIRFRVNLNSSTEYFFSSIVTGSERVLEYTFTADKDYTSMMFQAQSLSGVTDAYFKQIQITKTSTQKPFTEGIVPNGSLKVACDWTKDNYSYIYKKVSCVVTKNDARRFLRDNSYQYITSTLDNYSTIDAVVSNSYRAVFGTDGQTGVLEVQNFGTPNTLQLMGAISYGKVGSVESFDKFLAYKSNLTQSQLEGELAKDIYLPHYHHQPNSVINTYGITGMVAMYLYQPALTSAEVDAELEKDIRFPKQPKNLPLPNYKGEDNGEWGNYTRYDIKFPVVKNAFYCVKFDAHEYPCKIEGNGNIVGDYIEKIGNFIYVKNVPADYQLRIVKYSPLKNGTKPQMIYSFAVQDGKCYEYQADKSQSFENVKGMTNWEDNGIFSDLPKPIK